MKFEDQSHEEAERQERRARSKGMEPCQKQIQAQRERQSYIHSTRPRRSGLLPAASFKEPEKKRVCG